jgi:hypothetical protein
LLSHIGLVTVNLTLRAGAFFLAERTFLEPVLGIVQEVAAFMT